MGGTFSMYLLITAVPDVDGDGVVPDADTYSCSRC